MNAALSISIMHAHCMEMTTSAAHSNTWCCSTQAPETLLQCFCCLQTLDGVVLSQEQSPQSTVTCYDTSLHSHGRTTGLGWQGRAGQLGAGRGRAGQGRSGRGGAGQGRAGQGRTGRGRAGHLRNWVDFFTGRAVQAGGPLRDVLHVPLALATLAQGLPCKEHQSIHIMRDFECSLPSSMWVLYCSMDATDCYL